MRDTSTHSDTRKGLVHTMASEDWAAYVQRVSQGASADELAKAAGVHITTVYRWLRKPAQKSPQQVIAFARGLRQSPVEALIAAGYLEPAEVAGVVEVVRSAGDLPDDELVGELSRRLAERHVNA
ncbi:immunity repressor [Mycobacterium phage RonRayGun]|nr:immunity repressor [Mycobacterium phage RonRayGun]